MEKLTSDFGGAVAKTLETPELLEAILNYVPSEDLKNARAVARLWRDESLDNFRKSLVYVLDPATEFERMLKLTLGVGENAQLGGNEPDSQLPLYRFQEKPAKKYQLTEVHFFCPDPTDINSAESYFWNLCGPHITYLDLQSESYFPQSMPIVVNGLIWLFQTCPKLEELKFVPMWLDCHDSDDEGNEDEDSDDDEDEFNLARLPTFLNPISEHVLAQMREVLAPNMKSLSIPFAGKAKMCIVDISLARHDNDEVNLSAYYDFWQCAFSFMPNLKKLSVERLYFVVMEALSEGSATTRKLIQLEDFTFNGENSIYSLIQFRFGPLLKYLDKLEQIGGSLKSLALKRIPLFTFWERPRTFRNVLFSIRKGIEKFYFSFVVTSCSLQDGLPEQCKFDFFNFIFPKLTDLTLDFNFKFSRIFLFFDFSVFQGTPNLRRFRMMYREARDWESLKKRLATAYLKKGGPGEKWRFLDEVKTSGANEGLQILRGDGNETFDPAVGKGRWEDDIVLDKMKEFYFTGRFTTKAILVFGKWMKNLKEFAIIFDDETIFIPFVVWPGTLKKLTVLGLSFQGEEKVSEKSISELREMYPEVEIVVEG